MKKVDVDKLQSHELNQKIYGDEEISQNFLDSIDEFGILVPLKVKPDNTIISGHRRWKGAKKLGLDKIPVETITFSSELAEREAILTYNKQRDKTYSQKMKEAEEWKDIEKGKAEERQDQTKKLERNEKGQLEPSKENFPEQEEGQSRDKIAEKVKIGSGRTYDKAKKVWDEAKKGDEKAKKQVEKIDNDEESIHGAYKKIKSKEKKNHNIEVIGSSECNEYYTPSKYINSAKNVMGSINLDPASCEEANKTIKADTFFNKNENGLTKEWFNNVWLNPPYGNQTSKFAGKLTRELEKDNIKQVITLVNSHSTETNWFKPLWDGLLCFTDHRIDFNNTKDKKGSNHSNVFVYFGSNKNKFINEFKQFGYIVERVDKNGKY